MTACFSNRTQAGQALVAPVRALGLVDPVVLALPRGGVPVALELARALQAPLDLLLVRKIGAPGQPELAVAAVVDGMPPEIVVHEATRHLAGVNTAYIEREAERELVDIRRRRRVYLQGRPLIDLAGRSVIVVDDGIATGTTVRAALQALHRQHPAQLVLAVPVAPPDTARALRREVDHLVCLQVPEEFDAVGLHYDDFHQVNDDEVLALLADAPAQSSGRPPGGPV